MCPYSLLSFQLSLHPGSILLALSLPLHLLAFLMAETRPHCEANSRHNIFPPPISLKLSHLRNSCSDMLRISLLSRVHFTSIKCPSIRWFYSLKRRKVVLSFEPSHVKALLRKITFLCERRHRRSCSFASRRRLFDAR